MEIVEQLFILNPFALVGFVYATPFLISLIFVIFYALFSRYMISREVSELEKVRMRDAAKDTMVMYLYGGVLPFVNGFVTLFVAYALLSLIVSSMRFLLFKIVDPTISYFDQVLEPFYDSISN